MIESKFVTDERRINSEHHWKIRIQFLIGRFVYATSAFTLQQTGQYDDIIYDLFMIRPKRLKFHLQMNIHFVIFKRTTDQSV